MKAFILVVIAEIWTTLGQICLKKGADQIPAKNQTSWIVGLLDCVLRLPVLWLGAAGMVAGMLFWLWALKTGDLSFVYPLGSLQYIFALAAAHFHLQERINTAKLAGTLLIALGVVLTAAG